MIRRHGFLALTLVMLAADRLRHTHGEDSITRSRSIRIPGRCGRWCCCRLDVDVDVKEMSAGGVEEEVPEWSRKAEDEHPLGIADFQGIRQGVAAPPVW